MVCYLQAAVLHGLEHCTALLKLSEWLPVSAVFPPEPRDEFAQLSLDCFSHDEAPSCSTHTDHTHTQAMPRFTQTQTTHMKTDHTHTQTMPCFTQTQTTHMKTDHTHTDDASFYTNTDHTHEDRPHTHRRCLVLHKHRPHT